MSVSKQIANNALWKYLEQFSIMGIQFVGIFIMARYLSASDYGIVGMMSVFTILSNTIINSGFGQALIREKEVTKTDYSTILYFNIAVSIILYIILYLSAGLIANFYNQPIIESASKVSFLVLILNALSIVQNTKLQKEIQFKKLCIISLTASLLSCIIAIYLAYKYRNVWALVFQNLLTYLFRTILLWMLGKFIPVLKFSFASLKKYFKFSKNILLSGIIGTLFDNIYTLVIGKVYTASELGFYTQAERIKNLGSHTTTQVIQSVTYPILAKINNDNNDIKEGYKKIINITLMFVGIVMALLIGCAQDLFEFLMGNEIWRLSGTYLILMGINGILYPLHSVNQNILMVKGNSKTILYLEIARRTIMILIVAITFNFSVAVFISGLTLYSIVLLFLNLHYCGKPINYTMGEQLKDISPILIRLAIIIISMLLVGVLLQSQHVIIKLLSSIIVGLTVCFTTFKNYYYFQVLFKLLKSIIHR